MSKQPDILHHDADRRTKLKAFLLKCRSRLKPADVGLPVTGRRRISGLRREEVAELAGVCSDFYRWFETGRSIRVSVHANRLMQMGEMMAAIVHEINQPLTGVISNAGTSMRYLSANNTQAAAEYLQLVVRDAQRTHELVSRVRAMARKAPLEWKLLDINAAVSDVVALVEPKLTSHNVRLQLDLADGLPRVLGNRIQLQQIILNLLTNAAEAMDAINDRERIVVIASSMSDDGRIVVDVRDDGPGVNEQDRERIFDPFYTTKQNGTGMGLAICRSIAEAHGGDLRAVSDAPSGADFRLTLPAGEI